MAMTRLLQAIGRGRWLVDSRLMRDDDPTWAPVVEVREYGGSLSVRAELPGLTKAGVEVQVREHSLTIEGERKQRPAAAEGYFQAERSNRRFSRTIALPETVRVETTQATFKDGVLEISFDMPTAELETP